MNPARLRPIAAALLAGLLAAGCHHDSADQLRAKAEQYRRAGEYSAAVITLKNALEADPGDARTRYLLAATYVEAGESLPAEKEARLALKYGYAKVPAVVALGKALLLQGQYDKALADTEGVGVAVPELLCVRGDAHLALAHPDRARELYQAALAVDPHYAPALIGMGRLAFLAGDMAGADGFAGSVLARDPRNTDALMFKADLLRAQHRADQAFAAYDKVLAIQPKHRSAHIEKAALAIGLNRFDTAQAELDAAAKTTPGSVLVAYTQALLDFSTGKLDEAHDWLLKVLRVAPEHMPSVLLAGVVSLHAGSLYQAEHHLRHFLEQNPTNVYARKMLAVTLLRNGHAPDALEVLEPSLKAQQQDAQLLALAADSQVQVRHYGEASDLYARASALDPASASLRTSLGLSELGKGDADEALRHLQAAAELDRKSVEAGVALVRTELQLGHADAAMAAAAALEHAQPGSPAVHEIKGVVYAAAKDTAGARAQFERALALQPSWFPAAANLAQLALDDGRPAQARQHLLDFLAHNKGSVEAMSALASLAVHERQGPEATRWLEQAAAVDPGAIGPAVNLVAQYLRSGQAGKALELARRLQVSHPDDPDLLDLLGKSHLANGHPEEALAAYQQLAIALPRSAHVVMQVAALHLLLDRPREAEDDLNGVLAKQPDFPAAQLALAELYVRKGSYDLALMVAGHLQKLHPEAAAGYQLEGDVLMAKHKPALALAAFEKAAALHPGSELVVKTGDALRAGGRKDEAQRRLGEWLARHPEDLRVQLYQAQTALDDKDFRRAASRLEAVLRLAPDNVTALNNLALAYQQLGDARAAKVADAAYRGAGERPAVMDTLGWILVQDGDAVRGLALLQRAHALAPAASDIRLHLAAALYRTGDRQGARREAAALAGAGLDGEQAGELRDLLAELGRGG